MSTRLIIGMAATLLAATGTRAQVASDLTSYVLFADDEMRARGTRVVDGDLGVNFGPLRATSPLDAPNSLVVANTVALDPASTCDALFSNNVEQTGPGCSPATPFTGPILDLAAACGMADGVPACGTQGVTVGKHGTGTLSPGPYGSVTIKNGGRLTLAAGDYVFCDLRLARGAELVANGAVRVVVSTGKIALSNGTRIGPAPGKDITACDLEFVSGGDAITIQRQSRVRARICGPLAELRVMNGADIGGSFAAQTVRSRRAVAEGCPFAPTTTTSSTTPTTTTTTTTSSTTLTTTTSTTTTTTSSSSTTTTTLGPPVCGDSQIDPGEDCDPPGSSCTGAFTSICQGDCTCPPASTTTTTVEETTTTTTSSTTSSTIPTETTTTSSTVPETTTTTTAPPTCGNSQLDPGEDCDPPGSSCTGAFVGVCQEDCTCPAPTTTTTEPVTTTTSTSTTTTSTPETSTTLATTTTSTTSTTLLATTTTSTTTSTSTTLLATTTTSTTTSTSTTLLATTTTSTTTSTTTTTLLATTTTSTTTSTTTTSTTTSSTTSTSTTTTSTTTSTTTTTICSCCPTATSVLRFTTGTPLIGGGGCGNVKDADNAVLLNIDCGGLYTGGGGTTLPLPNVVPDTGANYVKTTGCVGTNYNLAPTVPGDHPAAPGPVTIRNCTSAGVPDPIYPACDSGTRAGLPCVINADCPPSGICGGGGASMSGCLFGPPLPLPNSTFVGASVCVINRVVTSASGSGSCSAGSTNLSLPLGADLYLEGDLLDGSAGDRPNIAGIQPCPICDGTLLCKGGPRHGLACTPADSASLGAAYPTSHDCPPPPGALGSAYIGALPIPFNLTTDPTGTLAANHKVANQINGQEVFCGFCSNLAGTVWKKPPVACTSNANCTGVTGCPNTVACGTCKQRTSGAFGTASASPGAEHEITLFGTPAGACLADLAPHSATLVSAFCIPPAFNATVDANGDLPGPGATALIGSSQLIP